MRNGRWFVSRRIEIRRKALALEDFGDLAVRHPRLHRSKRKALTRTGHGHESAGFVAGFGLRVEGSGLYIGQPTMKTDRVGHARPRARRPSARQMGRLGSPRSSIALPILASRCSHSAPASPSGSPPPTNSSPSPYSASSATDQCSPGGLNPQDNQGSHLLLATSKQSTRAPDWMVWALK